MSIYFGDLHNHCGITYGFGSLENAIDAAKGHLDFCAVTGHAMWPDMPERTPDTAFVVDFHKRGFEKLQKNWEYVRNTIKNANRPNEFVTFQGYEIHSAEYGDHHIISVSDDLPLILENSPHELANKLEKYEVIAIPHHVGYTPGYRGGNWEAFSEKISPVVEVFSKHGCGMSDESTYPYYHTMGPRDSRSSVFSGLKNNCKFGFAASTDHHAGYPGSYGDGRLAVLAGEKSRESIWEAILARRTYAVTGDKILCGFYVDDSVMGSEACSKGKRSIRLNIKGCHYFDQILIYKNLRPWKVVSQEYFERKRAADSNNSMIKVRIEMGWGDKVDGFDWKGSVRLNNGEIVDAEPCFKGKSVLAPSEGMEENPGINKLNNSVSIVSPHEAMWSCTTFKNPSALHPATSAIIFTIKGSGSTKLEFDINGIKKEVLIKQLLEGSISCHLKPYTSEAFLLHRAVPEAMYSFEGEFEDKDKEQDCDIYHAEIRQTNGQCAWISPIFVY